MKPIFVARGLRPDRALRAHALRRLRFALDRSRHAVQELVVRLSDINGPRGGIDKRCQIQLKIPGIPIISVDARADDAAVAVDLAAHRAARAVARLLSRLKSFERRRFRSSSSEPAPILIPLNIA